MKSHTWLNSLSQIPTHFVTSYSILCIHTQPIVNSLRPRLLSVIDWVQEHCISTICNESSRLTQLAHQQIEVSITIFIDLMTLQIFVSCIISSCIKPDTLYDNYSTTYTVKDHTEHISKRQFCILHCLSESVFSLCNSLCL